MGQLSVKQSTSVIVGSTPTLGTVQLLDNREYLMEKSSLIKFIEKYKVSKLSDAKLRQIFDKEVDKNDFDRNKENVWNWFSRIRQS